MNQLIERNAAELRRLHQAVHHSAEHRSESVEAMIAWQAACEEYNRRYDELAFPGGLHRGKKLIEAGDALAVETALIYLEQRPFYFRAKYHRMAFMKMLKRLDLAPRFKDRLDQVIGKLQAWRLAAKQSTALETRD